MEAFSLLKYWGRGGGGGAAGTAASASVTATSQAAVYSGQKNDSTIATSALRAESDEDGSIEGEDEGPFFDLEFAVPEEEESGGSRGSVGNDDGVDEEDVVEVTEEPGVSLSPSDDLFFKGRLVPLESSSLVFHGSDQNGKNQFLAGSLRKSAAKFRVFTLKGLKKPKSAVTVGNGPVPVAAPSPKHHQQSKFFTVKFKVEEVPIVSLFTRDNSSWSSGKGPKQSMDETVAGGKSKEMVNKYLNKIKPLYVKVSRRSNGETSKFAPHVGAAPVKATDAEAMPAEAQKQTHLPSHVKDGLRVVRKHLGKSRSASSAVAAVPSPPATSVVARRRDDSLLQQQDGIQSAIAHCKRSFNATREAVDSSSLPRSKSDSYDERSAANKRKEDGL